MGEELALGETQLKYGGKNNKKKTSKLGLPEWSCSYMSCKHRSDPLHCSHQEG